MNNDLISRSALLEHKTYLFDLSNGPKVCVHIEDIETAPAVDAVPVVHGRWDDSGRYRFPGGRLAVRCTECGCALTASEFKLNRWNYCPVCGAKMDGGSNG